MSDDVVSIHIDGASRGNPGDAAYAVVVNCPGRDPIEESGVLGKETNNVAEYTALVKALELAESLSFRRLRIHSDSELIVKQVNGEYRVKNEELKSLFNDARSLMKNFKSVELVHVRREANKRADELCNIILDGQKPKPAKSTSSSSNTAKSSGGKVVGDGNVHDDVMACLESAKACWARGDSVPSPRLVWDQIWSILEEGNVLRKAK